MKLILKNFAIANRKAISLFVHLILGGMAFVLAFLIRFDFCSIPPNFMHLLLMGLPVSVGIKGVAVIHYQLTSGLLRYVGINDLSRIIKVAFASTVASVVVSLVVFGHGFPRSIYLLDFLLTILLFGGVRFSVRILRESYRSGLGASAGKRTIIIGAGDAGEIALRSLSKEYMGIYDVLGFLDDDPLKKGMSMHGFPILGPISEAQRFVKNLEVTEVLIAISAANKDLIQTTVDRCAGRNINFHIMPAAKSFMTGEFQVEAIRKVRVDDLLGRDAISLNRGAVAAQIKGECVLITGAGGSIGSEIARQVAIYAPSKLILLDYAESALFEVDRVIRECYPSMEVVPCLVDVRSEGDVDKVFEVHQPQCVFHTAAYKHVPLMEQHPTDAIRTNVIGTGNVADSASRYEAEKFIMISTDKAVRPNSIMGASKRLCELIVARKGNDSKTHFASVRFGNVLGSNGSVIPIFEKQIANGGPVSVTDPNMTRFFMTISEAVELVLQTSTLCDANDVFVLDMGTPVKIMDLARNMIELSGMVVDEDIKIEITGARPGEKMHEELITYGENLTSTKVAKISRLRKDHNSPGGKHFDKKIAKLMTIALKRDKEQTVRYIWDIIQDDQKNATLNNLAS